MTTTTDNLPFLKAAQEFYFDQENGATTQRNLLNEALEKARSRGTLTGIDLGILLKNRTTEAKSHQDFSPFDIAVEAIASKRDLMAVDLLKTATGVRQWPENLYVYADYTPSLLLFPQPPPENLYAAELPKLESTPTDLEFGSVSSKNTGRLFAHLSGLSNGVPGQRTIRAGIYSLFHSNETNVGAFGSVTFSPKVIWESFYVNYINLYRSKLYVLHTQTVSPSIVLTVDIYSKRLRRFVPLKNYQEKSFPITQVAITMNDELKDDKGQFRTGELEHSFLAHSGETYRLGVIAQLSLSWLITDIDPIGGVGAAIQSALTVDVPAITLYTSRFP